MISIGRLQFYLDNGPKLTVGQSKMQIKKNKNCSRVSIKRKILCFLITNHYQTTIFFDQMSTIHRYISEIHCAWIMYINCSLKTKDGILAFVKYLKIFPMKISLSVPHHVSMRPREFVIIAARELVIWYHLVLFQN